MAMRLTLYATRKRYRHKKSPKIVKNVYLFSARAQRDNRGKCHTVVKRMHIPIYLQPFLRYSKLLVENCDIFRPTSV